MKKHFLRTVATLLTVFLILAAAPLNGFVGLELPELSLPEFDFKNPFTSTAEAATESGTCGKNLTWTLDTETGILTISGAGAMTEFTSISDAPWYSKRSHIKIVNIANGVTSIGERAFYWCSDLTSITIPDSVTSIGNSAFSDCSGLTSITVNSNNPSYSSDEYGVLFNKDKSTLIQYPIGNTRTNYTIPDSVTTIGEGAFAACDSLTSITIPDSVTTIGGGAFYGCTGLTSITIPDSVTNIGNSAFYFCDSLTSITIGNSVTSIGEWAFAWCSGLTSITIPDSVTTIGNYAFSVCTALTSITIGNGVTTIGNYAFSDCDSLTSITVNSNNPSYSSDEYGVLFNKDKSTLIQYPIGNTRTNYTVPGSVTSIGNYAFYECTSLTSITIGDSVTSIGKEAFRYCSGLTSITIGNGVTTIGNYAFSDCDSLTSITIGNGVTTIGGGAFFACTGLTSITIPDGVTTIGDSAFAYCRGLTSITIPDSVTTIDYSAFSDCNNLTNVYYAGSEEEWNTISIGYGNDDLLNANIHFNWFDHAWNDGVVTAPTCTEIGYTTYTCTLCGATKTDNEVSATGHSYTDHVCTVCGDIEIIDSGALGGSLHWEINGIGSLVISGTGSVTGGSSASSYPWHEYRTFITNIVIEKGVTYIENYAFSDCTSLVSVDISSTVTHIGNYTFYNCSSLTVINIPDSVTHIGESAFEGCVVLKEVYVTNIYVWLNITFTNETSNPLHNGGDLYINNVIVTNIIIPEGITVIKNYTFTGCTSIVSVNISSTVTVIENYAFYNCKSLTIVNLPDNITHIGESAFAGCVLLKSVHITNILMWLNITFDNATSNPLHNGGDLYINNVIVTNIIIPEGITVIKNYAFYGCTSIVSVNISSTVTKIENYAFYNCASITDVYYASTQANWEKITIGEYNDALLRAILHFVICNHTWSEWTVTIHATVESEGLEVRVCSACHTEETRVLEKIPSELIVYTPYTIAKVTTERYLVVMPFTTVESLFTVVNGTDVLNASGAKVSLTANLATGMRLVILDRETVVDSMTIVVLGDITGDGDISGDGSIASNDARAALRISVGLDNPEAVYRFAAKVGGSDTVTSSDARLILRASVGLEDPTVWFQKIG